MTALNQKIICYLSEDANRAIAELASLGMDEDLALAVLEQLWPESAIYDIPNESVEPWKS